MRFGLIGTGCIGQLRAEALAKVTGTKLVAVTDIDRQRAAQVATSAKARVCKDVAELLSADRVEAVIVSSEHHPSVSGRVNGRAPTRLRPLRIKEAYKRPCRDSGHQSHF